MPARITIERVLRDDDDSSGQSIRDWKIESEPGIVTIKLKHGTGFLILRSSDVDAFTADLKRAKDLALSLTEESERA
jgi:hypothetical protein